MNTKRVLVCGGRDVVAFPGGKGTAHMVKISKKANVETIEVEQ